MSTTLVLHLDALKMSRLRDLVNDKADDLFIKLGRAEEAGNAGRVEGLRTSLAFWNDIDIAIRDAQPAPMEDRTEPDATAAMPGTGVSFAQHLKDTAIAMQRTLVPEERAEGRVTAPRPARTNPHD